MQAVSDGFTVRFDSAINSWKILRVEDFRILWSPAMSTGPRGGRTRHVWTRRKRPAVAAVVEIAEDAEIRQFFTEALTLNAAPSTFDMDLPCAREELARSVWRHDDLLGEMSMTKANPELAAIIEVLIRNTYRGGVESTWRAGFRVESILVDLQRAQSQKKMPMLTVRLSCACLRAQLSWPMWEVFSLCFPGLLASPSWIEEFVTFASRHRPVCEYEELPLVGGVLFDNYTRKVLYSSKATCESHGFLLHMTNWGSLRIPRMLAPANFDAQRACECLAEYWL